MLWHFSMLSGPGCFLNDTSTCQECGDRRESHAETGWLGQGHLSRWTVTAVLSCWCRRRHFLDFWRVVSFSFVLRFVCLFVSDRVLLYSLGWPGTRYIDLCVHVKERERETWTWTCYVELSQSGKDRHRERERQRGSWHIAWVALELTMQSRLTEREAERGKKSCHIARVSLEPSM